jgi:hypothetical protein
LSNEDLWEITKQEQTTAQIGKGKWHSIAHLKKTRRINRESSTRLISTGSTKMWETKKTWRRFCRRGNRRKRKDLERGEEVGK